MKNPPKSWFPGFLMVNLVAANANPPPIQASQQMELDCSEWNSLQATPSLPGFHAPT